MSNEKYLAKTPTNASVARRIGLTNGGVSRIRRGNRNPSNDRVQVIEKEYGWPIADQYAAIKSGSYAAEFERVINE